MAEMADKFDPDRTRVNFAGLAEGEAAFGDVYRKLVGELDSLEADLNQQVAIWQGEAKVAYDRERANWQLIAKDLADVVNAMAGNINITNMNMQQVERINTMMFDGR